MKYCMIILIAVLVFVLCGCHIMKPPAQAADNPGVSITAGGQQPAVPSASAAAESTGDTQESNATGLDEINIPGYEQPLELGMSFKDFKRYFKYENVSSYIYEIKNSNVKVTIKDDHITLINARDNECSFQSDIKVGDSYEDVIAEYGKPFDDYSDRGDMIMYYVDSQGNPCSSRDKDAAFGFGFAYMDGNITGYVLKLGPAED